MITGKRKRPNTSVGLTSRNKSNVTANTKRRKVQTFWRYCLHSTNTINKLREVLGTSVYQIDYNHKFSGNTGFTRHSTQASYFIIIHGYTGYNDNTNHAIAAVRRGNSLFVFDPWGRGRRLVTNLVAFELAKELSIENVYLYNGPNLQMRNNVGVCVGFSVDFLLHIRNKNLNRTTFNTTVSSMFRANANNPDTMARALTRREDPGPNSVVSRRN